MQKNPPQILFGQPHARNHLMSERDKEQIQSPRNNDRTVTRDEYRAFIAVICTLDLITIILAKANAFKNASIRRRSRLMKSFWGVNVGSTKSTMFNNQGVVDIEDSFDSIEEGFECVA